MPPVPAHNSLRFQVREYITRRLISHPSATVGEEIIDIVTEFLVRQERAHALLEKYDLVDRNLMSILDHVTNFTMRGTEISAFDFARDLHVRLTVLSNQLAAVFDDIEEALVGSPLTPLPLEQGELP